ncbi:methionine biosynthesis protein MetW [Nitrospirillum amazonense]|uniref:Methionine biosynthesis protein MetW n=1 Tax=Nitrospirillum amazonense TaxID=28077 RepID=A0A560FIN9_9PROT|nr:methionine biosynthesis protein MetW [Nitrospirillum amazonense]TWB21471.1 methionine biosynthesis protein MetW [Nitrospirillum amazonense]
MDATVIPPRTDIRGDLRRIADMVSAGARVLDVGCGDGALLDLLTREKGVDGRGVELGMDGVRECVSRGLSVIQGDADTDLKDYPSDAFDYVILSQTLQATRDPRGVLLQMLRIGRRVIVSFPNFGYWRVRLALLLTGRMPVTDRLGFQWWETPNIHFCTIADFTALCADLGGVTVERSAILDHAGRQLTSDATTWRANWSGEQGIFLLRRD